jgi:hypothetical protein
MLLCVDTMNHLQRIIQLHDGNLILPFLNYPDILVFMRCNKEMYHMYMIYNKPFSFYGLCLPISKGIWSDLFYQRYESLEEALIAEDDLVITYHHFDIRTRQPARNGPRTTRSALFNGLTLMEIAYMLRDPRSIALLERYNRTTAHHIYSYQSTYSQHAHALLVAYADHDVKSQLQAKQPKPVIHMEQYMYE